VLPPGPRRRDAARRAQRGRAGPRRPGSTRQDLRALRGRLVPLRDASLGRVGGPIEPTARSVELATRGDSPARPHRRAHARASARARSGAPSPVLAPAMGPLPSPAGHRRDAPIGRLPRRQWRSRQRTGVIPALSSLAQCANRGSDARSAPINAPQGRRLVSGPSSWSGGQLRSPSGSGCGTLRGGAGGLSTYGRVTGPALAGVPS
jgi:hypothetical protein